MYLPFYKHFRINFKAENVNLYKVEGVSYNSDGFTDASYPSTHIRYPEVTEHYLDPNKGGIEQKHSYKTTAFQGYLLGVYWYLENAFFTTLNINFENMYNPPESYKDHLKHLVARPTEDISMRYGKISEEAYYNEDGQLQKKVEYKYQYSNSNDYSLCVFTPNISKDLFFGFYSHIGRESFRTFLPVSKRTVTYQGTQGEEKVQMEYFSYNKDSYLKEHAMLKSNGDSLITSHIYGNYSTSHGFQMLPVSRSNFLGTAGGRKMLASYTVNYRPQEVLPERRYYWNVVARELQFDGNDKLIEKTEYTHYDNYGNVIESVRNDSKHTVYLWSHYGQNPRARIENATYQEVSAALGKKPEDLSASTLNEPALEDGFLSKLPYAQVYTYWCSQGKNVAISTAPNDQSVHYMYDTKGRLVQTFRLNEEGRMEILQLNDYHLIND